MRRITCGFGGARRCPLAQPPLCRNGSLSSLRDRLAAALSWPHHLDSLSRSNFAHSFAAELAQQLTPGRSAMEPRRRAERADGRTVSSECSKARIPHSSFRASDGMMSSGCHFLHPYTLLCPTSPHLDSSARSRRRGWTGAIRPATGPCLTPMQTDVGQHSEACFLWRLVRQVHSLHAAWARGCGCSWPSYSMAPVHMYGCSSAVAGSSHASLLLKARSPLSKSTLLGATVSVALDASAVGRDERRRRVRRRFAHTSN